MRLMKFAATCLGSLVLAVSGLSAHAGDTANLDILGFSDDGAIFAFEEYGIQDGSGFPYANRYYIETDKDEFVAKTPIRLRLDDESKSIADVRQGVEAQVKAISPTIASTQNRGWTAAYRALTQLDGDRHELRAHPRPIFPPIDPAVTLRLTEIELANSTNCEGFDEKIVGFKLEMLRDGEEPALLNDDQSIPKSRACPTGYSIVAMQTFYPQTGNPAFAILIGVTGRGFEGPDNRYIAITGRF